MQEFYMYYSLSMLATLGVLLAHGYVLARFGVSPSWVLSLVMSLGGVASQATFEEAPAPPPAAEVKPAEPDAKPAPAPTPQPQPQPQPGAPLPR